MTFSAQRQASCELNCKFSRGATTRNLKSRFYIRHARELLAFPVELAHQSDFLHRRIKFEGAREFFDVQQIGRVADAGSLDHHFD